MIEVSWTDANGTCHLHLFASNDMEFAEVIFALRKMDSTDVELHDWRR